MIDDFLRLPRTPLEWGADLVRALGVLGIAAAFIWFAPTDAGVVAAALPAVFAPRFLGARAGFDLVSGLVVLAAAWSNVFDLYRSVPGWDLVMHVVCTGVLAALLYLALARLDVVPAARGEGTLRRTPVVVVTALGLALGAMWEMIEWLGKTFVTDEIFVTYTDTIGDLAADGVGGLLAGFAVAFVRLTRRDPDAGTADRAMMRGIAGGSA
ncbi:hypothetical protein [Agromyces aerolatus]|uniref:hypothetical protein n=1 Tax=Agromyces sp. LY-1074 TaxID=3074080 RepID=UPI0028631534|nr:MULTISPECIES: hypothetical protein [unclassified Agromyces]MDR5700204.1 hypothetical protein [Agromyces sp. LY-1074]MDR5706428.1 hypothetical protein [Agromyces sp. LY-1358]